MDTSKCLANSKPLGIAGFFDNNICGSRLWRSQSLARGLLLFFICLLLILFNNGTATADAISMQNILLRIQDHKICCWASEDQGGDYCSLDSALPTSPVETSNLELLTSWGDCCFSEVNWEYGDTEFNTGFWVLPDARIIPFINNNFLGFSFDISVDGAGYQSWHAPNVYGGFESSAHNRISGVLYITSDAPLTADQFGYLIFQGKFSSYNQVDSLENIVQLGVVSVYGDPEIVFQTVKQGEIPSFSLDRIIDVGGGVYVDSDGYTFNEFNSEDIGGIYFMGPESPPPLVNISFCGASSGVNGVHYADVDKDGGMDIIASASGGNEVFWLQNNFKEGERWTKHLITDTATNAQAVHSGDFNNDGFKDVVSSYNSTTVSWYENPGDSETPWGEHTISSSLTGVTDVVSSDLDGDGSEDVIVACGGDSRIVWFKNGSWDEMVVSTSPLNVQSVFVADIDRDGDIDVLSASKDDDRIIWHRNEDGAGATWSDIVISDTSDGARDAAAGDVDGDGDLDVIAVSSNDNTVAWFENPSDDLSPWTKHVISSNLSGAASLEVADLNNDAALDVIAASPDTNLVWYINANGDGSTWSEPEVNYTTPAVALSSVDLDHDGDFDVIAAASSSIYFIRNEMPQEAASFQTETSIAADISAVWAIGDIDGDGAPDMVHWDVDQFVWYKNANKDGTVWEAQPAVLSSYPELLNDRLFIFDVDGDGDNDVLPGMLDLEGVIYYENVNGDGTVWTERFYLWPVINLGGPDVGFGTDSNPLLDFIVSSSVGNNKPNVVYKRRSLFDWWGYEDDCACIYHMYDPEYYDCLERGYYYDFCDPNLLNGYQYHSSPLLPDDDWHWGLERSYLGFPLRRHTDLS